MTGPFTAGDLNTINTALKQAHEMIEHIDNAKKCGINCEQYEQQRQYYHDALTKLKMTYFPGRT